MKALDAIETFLASNPHSGPDLLARWNRNLETQINTIKGEPVEDRRNTWTNGTDTWWSIRIPKGANDEPTWNDYQLRWSLDHYAAEIGTTGWDWVNRRS